MYGQLKSTVRCLECGNISISFDPFLTLCLPVSRPSKFSAALVPYEVYRTKAGSDSEEDPDYKDDSDSTVLTEHFVYSFDIESNTKVKDIKKQLIDKVSKIGQR